MVIAWYSLYFENLTIPQMKDAIILIQITYCQSRVQSLHFGHSSVQIGFQVELANNGLGYAMLYWRWALNKWLVISYFPDISVVGTESKYQVSFPFEACQTYIHWCNSYVLNLILSEQFTKINHSRYCAMAYKETSYLVVVSNWWNKTALLLNQVTANWRAQYSACCPIE